MSLDRWIAGAEVNAREELKMPSRETSHDNDSRDHRDAQERMAILAPYYHWTFSHFKPPYGERLLDAACGIGNATHFLLAHASQVVACDNDRRSLETLQRRIGGDSRLLIECLDLDSETLTELGKYKFTTIVCFDFLEHVEDDRCLLRRFRAISGDGARLLLKVPAGPNLYCSIDRASGHYRRYTRLHLTSVLQESGWEPLFVKPMNLVGMLAYWINGTLLGHRTNFSRTFAPRSLRLIARVIPFLQLLDRQVGPPFGLSLVAEAVRKNALDPNSH